jgi:hypothetical protein
MWKRLCQVPVDLTGRLTQAPRQYGSILFQTQWFAAQPQTTKMIKFQSNEEPNYRPAIESLPQPQDQRLWKDDYSSYRHAGKAYFNYREPAWRSRTDRRQLEVHARRKRRQDVLRAHGAQLLAAMALPAGSADAEGQCDPLRNSRRHRGHDGQSIEDLAALSMAPTSRR